jgi:pyruvate formate-lyase/glycerol dehydratase family glycyl radical enzyme
MTPESAVQEKPIGITPFDQEWPVSDGHMGKDTSPFPRVNRFTKRVLESKFSIDHHRAYLVTEAYRKHEHETQIVKCALALANVLDNIKIEITEDELIVGEMAAPMKCAPIFPEFSLNWVLDEIDNYPFEKRLHDQYYLSRHSKKKIKEVAAYWKGKSIDEVIISELSEEEIKGTNLGRGFYLLNLFMYGGIGHLQANYEKLFTHGFGGLKKQVREKMDALEKKEEEQTKLDFYRAGLITLEAAANYIKRYSLLASKMAGEAKNEERRRELLQIAATCDWVAENPPRTFREALQLLYLATTIILIESNGHSVSIGRFDQFMYPFYSEDIKSGRITKEEVQELIEIYFIKHLWWTKLRDRMTVIANSGRGMGGDSITLGGIDEEGNDATNDLTFMCLDAIAHTRSGAPWIAVRWHENTPWELKVKTVNVIRIGTGQPKVFNDQAAIPASLRAGRTLEDSRNYHVVGCVEIDSGGKEYGWHDAAYFSIAKILELAINDGRCIGCGQHCDRWKQCGGIGERLGPQTGKLTDFTSFDQVLEAYDKQMAYWVDLMIRGIEVMDQVHQRLKPLPYLSNLIDDCMEKGVDVSAGGAKYNFTGPQAVGVGTTADGMAAIKQLIFEEQKVKAKDFLNALENNWVGEEVLYALVNSDKVHHYGNDDDYADELARLATDTYCKYVENRTNSRGGKYLPGIYSVSANVALGLTQWASADGRVALEPVSDCISPVHTKAGSHDVRGPSAIAKSVTKLDHIRAGNGTLLNWKFSPSCVSGEVGRDNLIALLEVYFDRKGMHSQFNVIGRETLEKALENPEDYRYLLVRVAGYSAFFVELSKPLQYDIMGRTELSFD